MFLVVRSMIGRHTRITTTIVLTIMILALLNTSTKLVLSKPSWLKPGFYIEYTLRCASASELVIRVTKEELIKAGILYKYKMGNNITIYSDVPIEKLREHVKRVYNKTLEELVEESRDKRAAATILGFCTNATRKIIKIKRAIKEGKLPIWTRNETAMDYSSFHFTKYIIHNATYSWRCIGFKGDLALFEVRFSGYVTGRPLYPPAAYHIDRRFKVLVDTSTRKVYTLDGKYIGITPIWVEPENLKFKNRVLVVALHKNKAYGVAWDQTLVITSIGNFKAYKVIKVMGLGVDIPVICYDAKTGVLLSALVYADPVLHYFMDIQLISSFKQPMLVSKVKGIELDSCGVVDGIVLLIKDNLLPLLIAISIPVVIGVVLKVRKMKRRV